MRTLVHKYGTAWSEALPYACYCINTHAIGNTNISPYEMVYGRKPSDPNAVAVTRPNVWRVKGGPQFLSIPEYTQLKLERRAAVMEDVKLEFINQSRHNQFKLRQQHYTLKYSVGDLVNRWTANPKTGMYGKLAYKNTGPYEIVGINPKNSDVYMLRPLGKPHADPTAHHVRELCPYITREAHEQQTTTSDVQQQDSMLEVKLNDHLLLPNGNRDYLTKVTKVEGPYVTVQYYNHAKPSKDFYNKQNLFLVGDRREVQSLLTRVKDRGQVDTASRQSKYRGTEKSVYSQDKNEYTKTDSKNVNLMEDLIANLSARKTTPTISKTSTNPGDVKTAKYREILQKYGRDEDDMKEWMESFKNIKLVQINILI